MNEIVFEVTQESDGGFVAECLSEPIFTQADDWETLRKNVKEAVSAFFSGPGTASGVVDSHRPHIAHAPRLNYTDEQLKQVKILSALDMLSPVYDQPQRMEDVRRWFENAGLVDVQLKRGYNGINGKGRRTN
jgi:hypothetical protein